MQYGAGLSVIGAIDALAMTDRLTIRKPDDWHLHLRDDAMLEAVVGFTARQFARAVVMPNLAPPITRAEQAEAYRARIIAALPEGSDFTPLMTCYLTDDADPQAIVDGHARDVFTACKLYPANATTNSAHGVSDIAKLRPVFEAMQRSGMPLLIHGEVTDRDVDMFDREAVFIERTMAPLVADFPELRIVLEHITTEQAVDFVSAQPKNVGATITPQHLQLNRNALFDGGLRPHAYCLPVVKRERHRLAVRRAATSGDSRFFLGTDSAPHVAQAKQSACGCAGIFNAPFALESYIAVFDADDALDRFEAFASINGPRFYGLVVNEATLTLERAESYVPDRIDGPGDALVPFHAGETLGWRLAD